MGESTSSPRFRNNSVTGVGTVATAAESQDVSDACRSRPDSRPPGLFHGLPVGHHHISNVNGSRWGWGATSITMFHTIVPPNSNQYKWNSCRDLCVGCSPDDSLFSNAQSNHSGGVNVLFADGSVKFIKDSISMPTWWALGTKGNGEVISSDSY